MQFASWYQKQHGGLVACGIGIRTDESLNRFRTITFQKNKETFKNYNWTTRVKFSNQILDAYNFYPIYDFRVEDIWGAVSLLDLKYNKIYDLMYKNGVSLAEQRICQPYGDDQRKGLDQFKALEYETWAKVLNRVNGVNFGNIYCRTSALGDLKTSKPDFMSWQQYTVFLLESIGIYNRDLMMNYYRKIKKFMIWYRKKYGVDFDKIPDEASKKLENQKKVISWRRIARAVEKNDFYLKRLSFAQTKTEEEELRNLAHKWDNLLSKNTVTSDPDLSKFIKQEVAN